MDDACEWLSQRRPSLDDVADRLRHLLVVQRELEHVTDLLRQHVFAAIGEPTRDKAQYDEDPF